MDDLLERLEANLAEMQRDGFVHRRTIYDDYEAVLAHLRAEREPDKDLVLAGRLWTRLHEMQCDGEIDLSTHLAYKDFFLDVSRAASRLRDIGRRAPSGEESYAVPEIQAALYYAEDRWTPEHPKSLWGLFLDGLKANHAAAPEHGEEGA